MDNEQLLATIYPRVFFEVMNSCLRLTESDIGYIGSFGIGIGTIEESGSTHLVSAVSVNHGEVGSVLLLSHLTTTPSDDASRLITKVPPFISISNQRKDFFDNYNSDPIKVLLKKDDCNTVGIAIGDDEPVWGTVPLADVNVRPLTVGYSVHYATEMLEQKLGAEQLANNIVALIDPQMMHNYLKFLEVLGYRGDLCIRYRPLNLVEPEQRGSSLLLLSVPVQKECGLCLESELCLAAPLLRKIPEEFATNNTEIARLPYALAKRIAAPGLIMVPLIIGSDDNGTFCRVDMYFEIIQKNISHMTSFPRRPPLRPGRGLEGLPETWPAAVTMPASLCSGRSPLEGLRGADYAEAVIGSIAYKEPDEDSEWNWRDFFIDLGTDPVESLIPLLSSDIMQWKAAWALGDLGDPRAIEPLIAAYLVEMEEPYYWESPSYNLKMVIGYVLGKFKDSRAVDALIQEINREPDYSYGEHSNIGAVAAWALGEIGDTRAIPCLEKASNMSAYLWSDDDMGFVDATIAEIAVFSEIYKIFDSGNPIENALMKLQEMQRSE